MSLLLLLLLNIVETIAAQKRPLHSLLAPDVSEKVGQ